MPLCRTLAVAVAGFSILAITVSACASPPDRDTVDDQVAACLDDAGQDSSLVNLDKRRLDDAVFNSAFEGCAAALSIKVLPPGEETRQADRVVHTFVSCLRNAGWDIPEPTRGEHGVLNNDGYDRYVPDSRFPEFQVDRQLCIEALRTSRSPHEHPEHDHDDHHHNE